MYSLLGDATPKRRFLKVRRFDFVSDPHHPDAMVNEQNSLTCNYFVGCHAIALRGILRNSCKEF